VRFWDASALAPLFVPEPTSRTVARWLEGDSAVAVWALTRIEILSAIARKQREQLDASAVFETARGSLDEAAAL
jgi:predicted nucleic acid-binding protein